MELLPASAETGRLLLSTLQDGTCALHKQLSQISVAALADAEKLLLASGRILSGHQPEPGGEASALLKLAPLPIAAIDRCSCQWSDAGNRIQPLTGFLLVGPT